MRLLLAEFLGYVERNAIYSQLTTIELVLCTFYASSRLKVLPAAKTNLVWLFCFAIVFISIPIQAQAARGGRHIRMLAPLNTCIGHFERNGQHLNRS